MRENLRSKIVRGFERAIRFDMHRAQPRNFRVGQRERARNERTKTDVAHECRQLRTQLLTNEEGRRCFCFGRFIFCRLISYETTKNKSSETKTSTAFLVGEKLRPQLAALMGNVGFRALLSRALALSSAEIPWLRAVQVKADGSFEALDKLGAQVDPDKIFEGRAVLLAQLLGLLVAFIGENLTLRLVREVWPKLSLNDVDLGTGDKNEKAE